jgi:FecR protein
MYRNKWMHASLLTVLCAMQSTVSNAEPRIGLAASTRPNAEALSAESTQTLSAGSEIYANQTVRTGNRGMADLVFIDSTNLGIGPASEVRLDKFIYDPTGSSGSVVMNATRGAFRFVTGTQAKRAYQVNTPHGSLGVRGTVVEVVINPNKRPAENECVTKIRLVEGEATYDVAKTKKKARLTQPNQVACISPSGEISYSVSSTSILGFSVEQAPPPPAFIPGTGGGVNPNPPPPCVSPTTPNCG